MARITVEDCLSNVKNRFELVLVAAKRARDITRRGLQPMIEVQDDKPTVIALREIAAGLVNAGVLDDVHPESEQKTRESELASNLNAPPQISLNSIGVNTDGVLPEVVLRQDLVKEQVATVMQPVLLKDFTKSESEEPSNASNTAEAVDTVDSKDNEDSSTSE